MLATRPATPDDFEAISAIIASSYLPHDPGGSMPGRHSTALAGAPCTWWGDPALRWWLALVDGCPSAFALWRHVGRNVHLHSFFVDDAVQKRGVGADFLRFHFTQAAADNPLLESYSLHVRQEATWATRFYARHCYVARDPRAVLATDERSALADWVHLYDQYGWPEEGKLLLHRA